MHVDAQFCCAACGRRYRWKAQLAGRKVKCACGEEMVYPPVVPADEGELYDLVEPERPRPAVSAVAPPPPPPVAQVPLQYQTPRTAAEAPDAYFPDKTIDFHVPLVLVAAGTLIEIAAALIRGGRSPTGVTSHLASLGLHLVLGTATMLVGVLVAVRFRGIELGKLPTALLKLAAVAITPGAAVTLFSPALRVIPFGGLFALGGQFVLYFALLGMLFKLDESDTWYCVCVIFVINVVLYFALLGTGLALR